MWTKAVPSGRPTWLVVRWWCWWCWCWWWHRGLCLGAERRRRRPCRGHPCLTRQSRWQTAVIWQEVRNRAWPQSAPPQSPSSVSWSRWEPTRLGFSEEQLISFPQWCWWWGWDKAPEMKCNSPGKLRSLPLLYIGLIFYLLGWVSYFFFFYNLFFKLGEIFRPCRQDVFCPENSTSAKLLFATKLNMFYFMFAL